MVAGISDWILSLGGWFALAIVFLVPAREASAFLGFVFLGKIRRSTRPRRRAPAPCSGDGAEHVDLAALLRRNLVAWNLLVRVSGTPLGDLPPEDPIELVRTIATARILMPASTVRLSAGRLSLSDEAQALCFLAGANSMFLGERLLTTPNPSPDRDAQLFEKLGLRLQEH